MKLFSFNILKILQSAYSIYSKSTQIQTSMMSNLKKTHLKEINESAFQLFQQCIQNKEIQYLNELFKSSNFELRMAGGAVRDILCNISPNDIDFASNAKPDEIINILKDKSNVRIITTVSGIKHGTVTARINNSQQFEITTLRIDANTDGRHAEVEFVNDWKLDASRRDLTINSMFIDSDAILYDYFDGENDLKNKLIRFVGDPDQRLKEDYLRLFRYFRFHVRFGMPGYHELMTLNRIKDNISGLEQISGERIWSEMKRILSNANCDDSIHIMFHTLKIGKYLGFSKDIDLEEFVRTIKNLQKYKNRIIWMPTTLFASLITDTEELSSIVSRLKLSNYERDSIIYIISNRNTENIDRIALERQLALAPMPNQNNLKEFIIQFLIYKGVDFEFIESFCKWFPPKFPINGTMIANVKKRQIGIVLDYLKRFWAENNFSITQKQFDEQLERILKELNK